MEEDKDKDRARDDQTKGIIMYEMLTLIGVLGFWLLLQLVILPKLGYST